MKRETLGQTIAALRKEQGMTQLELAEQMGVTDKAVSKWERDLSCPDIQSFPKLAEIFGVSVDELLQVKTAAKGPEQTTAIQQLVPLVLKAVALGMGVAVAVQSAMGIVTLEKSMALLGIGLACLAMASIQKQ